MRQPFLRPQFVDFIPEQLEDGVLYISERYRTAAHRCCCGCGQEVVTPLGLADWSLQVVNGIVTLYPSIGNWSLPCRSHYWIRCGRVIWARDMSRQEIERGRRRDQCLRDGYFAEVNRRAEEREQAPPTDSPQQTWPARRPPSRIARAWRALSRWFKRAE